MVKLRSFAAPLTMVSAGALALSLLFGNTSMAAPLGDGDLDPTFGTNGVTVTDFGGLQRAEARAIVQQTDGKLIAGGSIFEGADFAFALARYDANGNLDATFGNGGQVTKNVHFNSQNYTLELDETVTALAVQTDNKIIAAGYTSGFTNSDEDVALVRFNSDGSPDSTFGQEGVVITEVQTDNYDDEALGVAVLGDGKILVGGWTGTIARADYLVLRYNSDGSLDTTFDTDGKVIIRTGTSGGGRAYAMLVQPDGKVVLAGEAKTSCDNGTECPTRQAFVIRVNVDGSLDTSFDSDGKVTTAFDGNSSFRAIALQPDGKLVAAGTANKFDYDFALARYNSDGSLDISFGMAGKVVTDFAPTGEDSSEIATGVKIQADGKIVAAGYSNVEGSDNVVVRYNSDGSLDPIFSEDGKAFAGPGNRESGLLVQSATRIVIATGGSLDGTISGFVLLGFQTGVGAGPTRTATGTATTVPTSTATALPTNTSTPAPTPTIGPGCIFSDVCPGNYWLEPVRELVSRGAISGYNDNTFRPFNNTTRGQLAKIVVVAEGFPVQTPATPTFSDVATDNPFYGFIETAAARGIVSGYSNGTFSPFNNVTRGQLSKIIVVAESWALVKPAGPTFQDVDTNNPFYQFIETAYAHGIISGYDVDGGKEFRWGNNATRAQIAKIVALAVTEAN